MATREIENPFVDIEDYNCFACGPENKIGLKMRFFVDEEAQEVFSKVNPHSDMAGFPGVLHGGIQATLLDEVAFWAIWAQVGKPALTSRMEIELKKPVPMSKELEARARITEVKRKLATVDTWLTVEGQVRARAKVVYFLVDPKKLSGVSSDKVAEIAKE
jgi:acyl-coenzyme A thioesterase PaaI-like protein